MTLNHLFFTLNLLLMNKSILSEYFKTNRNASATAAASAAQIIMPHQVVKGINSNEKEVDNTDIRRVNTIITAKYLSVMEESPATKHKTSSGNIGKRNISDKIK